MRVIIDRFEGDIAVVEIGESILNAPRALFPDAQEGDTVEITVLGKSHDENGDDPHAIFERLRKKRRSKKAKPASADTEEDDPDAS